MYKHDFDFLLEKLSPIISKCHYAREPISPGEMLSATLRYHILFILLLVFVGDHVFSIINLTPYFRYLAAGVSMKSISYNYRLGMSTVSEIIKSTSSAIWNILRTEYLKNPTEEHWKSIAEGFDIKWNFPNCMGAVDGKHIRIQVIFTIFYSFVLEIIKFYCLIYTDYVFYVVFILI